MKVKKLFEEVLFEGTEALIGILKNGKVESVSVHWDGDLKNVGSILKKYYKNQKKIEELISLGNISVLGKNIGEKHDFNTHNKNNPNDTLFYARDRDEKLIQSVNKNKKEYRQKNLKPGIEMVEFVYLWDGKKWMYADSFKKDYKDL